MDEELRAMVAEAGLSETTEALLTEWTAKEIVEELKAQSKLNDTQELRMWIVKQVEEAMDL
jgi:hypothetical protein